MTDQASPDTIDRTLLQEIPIDADGAPFQEPWQAQAFALTVQLSQRGIFAWKEWTLSLGAEITAAKARGEDDFGQDYFRYWLAALEKLLIRKGLTDAQGLKQLQETTRREWPTGEDHVARRDPLVVG